MDQTFLNKAPKISVIVPVYRAEAYLNACVESILGQRERDFELLLIDDGSPDGCPALCDGFAARDPRVRVIHKPNGGVSAARNTGLDQARGSWIVFIDSDDWADPNYLEALLALQGEAGEEGVLVMTDYQPFTPEGPEARDFPAPFTAPLDGPDTDPQAFRDLIFGFRLFPPYCKLYRREVIEALGLRFNTALRTAEDFDFNMRYLARMKAVCYRPIPSYHYRVDYKVYRPSNHGVLGDSEIKSAHIMARGIVDLAKRMGQYETLRPEIQRWAANKHYFNRMPMLFAQSDAVGKAERRELYHRLISDPVYRDAAKAGIGLTQKSTTRIIGCFADYFDIWYLFYQYQQARTHKRHITPKHAPAQVTAAADSLSPAHYKLLDLVRLFCALLVVSIHLSLDDTIGFIPSVAHQAVPFFYLISGFFFTKKLLKSKALLRDAWAYARSILAIYAVWMLIVLPYVVFEALKLHPGESVAYYIGVVLRRSLLAGFAPYWYLLVLAEASLLLAAILRRRKYWLGWLLCILGLILQIVYGMNLGSGIGGWIHRVFYFVFSWENNSIMCGFPLMFLGSVFAKHEQTLRNRQKLPIALLYIISIIAAFFVYQVDHSLTWIPFGLLQALLLVSFCLIPSRRQAAVPDRLCRFARNLSSVVFLSHCLILILLDEVFHIWNSFLQFSIAVLSALLLLLLISRLNYKPINKLFMVKNRGRK